MRVQYGTSKIANSSDNSYGVVSNTGNELLNAFDMNYVISPDEKPFIRLQIVGPQVTIELKPDDIINYPSSEAVVLKPAMFSLVTIDIVNDDNEKIGESVKYMIYKNVYYILTKQTQDTYNIIGTYVATDNWANSFDVVITDTSVSFTIANDVLNEKEHIVFDPSTLYAVQYSSNKSKRVIVRMEDNSNAR